VALHLSADHATQLEVAAMLGVSDSLVSDYRRRIEQELRALSFAEIEEARRFEQALRERVRTLVLLRQVSPSRHSLQVGGPSGLTAKAITYSLQSLAGDWNSVAGAGFLGYCVRHGRKWSNIGLIF